MIFFNFWLLYLQDILLGVWNKMSRQQKTWTFVGGKGGEEKTLGKSIHILKMLQKKPLKQSKCLPSPIETTKIHSLKVKEIWSNLLWPFWSKLYFAFFLSNRENLIIVGIPIWLTRLEAAKSWLHGRFCNEHGDKGSHGKAFCRGQGFDTSRKCSDSLTEEDVVVVIVLYFTSLH